MFYRNIKRGTQTPFVTLFLHLDESNEYIDEIAMIIEEVLRQRLQGIKNEAGIWSTPAFPKLVYVLDENNCLKGGKYDYITELAAECTAKRMYPRPSTKIGVLKPFEPKYWGVSKIAC